MENGTSTYVSTDCEDLMLSMTADVLSWQVHLTKRTKWLWQTLCLWALGRWASGYISHQELELLGLNNDLLCICLRFVDHRLWSGVLPRQAHGVHCLLPEHYGVWDGEHSLPEGGVWRVRIQWASNCFQLLNLLLKRLCWFYITLVFDPQLGGLRALQLLRPAICAGEGWLSSLWGLQRKQLLSHWENDFLQANLLCRRFNKSCNK